MEGPTPSRAIFYGALSVHVGIYILLRTFPFWEHQFSVRILIGPVGLISSIIATGIARVQSSVKSQIAYASIAQIGIIFIEVAAGSKTYCGTLPGTHSCERISAWFLLPL
jgi:NADH-quinone oxidoreductase subunit L